MKKTREILLVLVITVVILELALQLHYFLANKSFLFHRVYTPIYVKDPDCGYRVKPNLEFHHHTPEYKVIYYSNQEGIRCSKKHEEYHNDNSKIKIILIGPSFAFGWGVNYEDSFAFILEKTLNNLNFQGGKKRVEVMNLGVPALPPQYQFELLKKEAPSYQPDMILQVAYGSPVLGELEHYDVRDGLLIRKDAGSLERFAALVKNSGIVFYSWIAYNSLDSFLNRQTNPKIIGVGRDLENYGQFAPDKAPVKLSLDFYRRLAAFSAALPAKLLIVSIPLAYEVHKEDLSRFRHMGVRGVQDIQEQVIFNRKFCDYLNQQGIPALDLTAAFQEGAQSSSKRLYYWLDMHWTPAGNHCAARAVANYLSSNQERLTLSR